MNFNEVFLQISKRQGPGFGAGLCAFSQLLSRLHNPQNSFQIVHVAGTNGKGSVCMLLAHALTCAGKKTGLFVSPHLVNPTERISVDDETISPQDFVRCVQKVFAQEQEKLNFFEILTATCFVYFAEKKCDYVVLETGLGGRKDPTNVCEPRGCIITSVGLDHTQLLGNTIEKIAAEKAGIIKPGVPVWCGPVNAVARTIIEHTATAQKSPAYFVEEGNPFLGKQIDWTRGNWLLEKEEKIYPLHLLGKCQPINACLVWQVARFLGVEETAILKAFETVQIPGRFEIIKTGKNTFILDGAHNPQAINALMDFWQQTPFVKQTVLVCGFNKDKDFYTMLKRLATHFKNIIITRPHSERAVDGKTIQPFLKDGMCWEPDIKAAVRRATSLAPYVLCTGSFYLIGAVRPTLIPQTEASSCRPS